MKHVHRLLCLWVALLMLNACGRSAPAPESSAVQESSLIVEDSTTEPEPEESSQEPSKADSETSSTEIIVLEESSEENSSAEEPEVREAAEEESEPDLVPVQTDSPIDAFYADVPRPAITLAQIPAYDGAAAITINDGVPFLLNEPYDLDQVRILLTPLDDLGRCGACMMMAGPETLPTAKRKSISSIKPSGWVQNRYPELISDSEGALYRRSHMLMFAFSGLNATEENLVTGTHTMNTVGMSKDETTVLDYIRNTGHHVIYRCTPFFEGDELLARGVLVEAFSLEDDVISICTFCYNVEPGIEIDYATGENHLTKAMERSIEEAKAEEEASEPEEADASEGEEVTRSGDVTVTYVLNNNPDRMRFHYPDCYSVKQIHPENYEEVECIREELISRGYVPCGNCNP